MYSADENTASSADLNVWLFLYRTAHKEKQIKGISERILLLFAQSAKHSNAKSVSWLSRYETYCFVDTIDPIIAGKKLSAHTYKTNDFFHIIHRSFVKILAKQVIDTVFKAQKIAFPSFTFYKDISSDSSTLITQRTADVCHIVFWRVVFFSSFKLQFQRSMKNDKSAIKKVNSTATNMVYQMSFDSHLEL